MFWDKLSDYFYIKTFQTELVLLDSASMNQRFSLTVMTDSGNCVIPVILPRSDRKWAHNRTGCVPLFPFIGRFQNRMASVYSTLQCPGLSGSDSNTGQQSVIGREDCTNNQSHSDSKIFEFAFKLLLCSSFCSLSQNSCVFSWQIFHNKYWHFVLLKTICSIVEIYI